MVEMSVRRDGRLLCARFAWPHRVLSHAVVRPGLVESDAVAWCQVDDDELAPPVDPVRLLAGRLADAGVPGAVGLLTSADLATAVDVERRVEDLAVRAVATVGLDNARRAGDPWDAAGRAGDACAAALPAGTINVLVRASRPLADAALIEMLAIAVEARAMAVLEGGVASRRSGLAASGTGTDCTVVAAPCGAPVVVYAGKHTALGHLVGAAVAAAVAHGVAQWLDRHPSRRMAGRPA